MSLREMNDIIDTFFNGRPARSSQDEQIKILQDVVEVIAKDYQFGAGPIVAVLRKQAKDALAQVQRLREQS